MLNLCKTFLLLLAIYVAATGHPAYAMDIPFVDKKPVFIRLKTEVDTLLRFPEPVKTINGATRLVVGPANESSPDYSILKVSPRIKRGSGSVVFILNSGKVVMLSFAVDPSNSNRNHSFFDFVEDRAASKEKTESAKISHVDFMRSMLLQKRIRGFKESRVSQEINTGNQDTDMELRKIYQGSEYNGYVYEIKNKNKKKTLVIDVRNLKLGKEMSLVCASVRYPFLAPGESTKLWVLARSDSSPERVMLPYTKIKVKRG